MVNIRQVLESDIKSLVNISRQTFWDTFSKDNTPENIHLYMDDQLTPEQLLAEMKQDNAQFYFMEHNNQILGYLKTIIHNNMQHSLPAPSLEIERLYMVQSAQGSGYGSQLFHFAIQKAQENHCKNLWLGVWENNHKAIAFYHSKGMQAINHHIFQLGNDLQKDWIMTLSIS